MTKVIMQILGILLLIIIMVGTSICYSPIGLMTEYSTQISVDKPDKIENAISNVVSDLGKRDFVPVNLKVKWHPASKTYVIYASGIDRIKLGKYEP